MATVSAIGATLRDELLAMKADDAVAAVAPGYFYIYPVEHVLFGRP
jgi:hypothetical protein